MSNPVIKKVRRLRNVFMGGLQQLEALEKQLVAEAPVRKPRRPTLAQEIKENVRLGRWRKPTAFKKAKP